jgi:hypothetical protein
MNMNKAILLTLAALSALAQDPVREVNVRFAAGTSSATESGAIKGYESVKYKLKASAGQQMDIAFKPSNRFNFFNVAPPDGGQALFAGADSPTPNAYSGKLPVSGEYVIDVYLMRNAARRNETSKFSITFKVTGGAAASSSTPSGAAVWPTKFNASGSIKCSAGTAALDKECDFRVVRKGRSGAEVWAVNPDGSSPVRYRLLKVENNVFTTSDGSKLEAVRKDDNWQVTCGNEHYFIPDAAIFGG